MITVNALVDERVFPLAELKLEPAGTGGCLDGHFNLHEPFPFLTTWKV